MKPMHEDPLAALIDRELKRLPDLTAPPTLIPRVQRAIEARAALPWWRQNLAQWPIGFRVLFVLLAAVLAAGTVFAIARFSGEVSGTAWVSRLAGPLGFLSTVWKCLAALGNAAWLAVRAAGPLFAWTVLILAVGTYLTCVGFGTLCYRLALQKA